MMNYLAELSFVDIFDAKTNKAFFWRVDNPLDYKCGVNGAKTFVEFIEKYPFMNNSNVLYRIACDMSDSGLIKSESARGFFNTLDTLLTPKSEISASGATKIRGRARRTINEVACDMGITSMKLLNFLALIGWIDNATVQPTNDSLTEGVLRKNSKMPFGFTITRKGERLIASKYQALSK
ncbi:TPA: hypothetical protein MIH20_10280 [Klebsiella pneumoniae]|uniref:hypothetical protein n=1 Tax=Klebsiella pneumoniae TaxID=573 RepID=UPI00190D2F20|nr:hypothetical protein [Klebsiella pneumoniae]HBT4578462.1 hypothetical protein [Klebsiella pneumoniae]HBX8077510.1 hypothetical protein [Klebsiella pneumoniae]HBZ7469473.1 hypothetical protein [Klebsiella pneumoniae]